MIDLNPLVNTINSVTIWNRLKIVTTNTQINNKIEVLFPLITGPFQNMQKCISSEYFFEICYNWKDKLWRGVHLQKLLITSAFISLLLLGCSTETEPEVGETEKPDQTEEVVEEQPIDDEMEEEPVEEEETSPVTATLTEMEPVSFSEVEGDWVDYVDFSPLGVRLHNQFYKIDGGYIASHDNDAFRYDEDLNVVWSNENYTRPPVEIKVDDNLVFNPDLRSQDSNNSLKVLNKETGDVVYAIDMKPYEEMSEVAFDDEAVYLVHGRISNPDDDLFADEHTLAAYNKADGSTLWSLDIPGVRLGGGRSHHYTLQQSDDYLYLLEQNENEDYLLVARSKEDGEVAWSENFTEQEIKVRLGLIYLEDETVYIITDAYEILGYDAETGEPTITHDYAGEVPGAEVPFPIFDDELLIWQDATDEYHHLKVANLETDEELWRLDMDGYFLAHYGMVGDTLIAFFGPIDNEADDASTLLARINPETGEFLDLADIGYLVSDTYGSYNSTIGMTDYDDTLTYFFVDQVFLFNE